MKDGDAAPRPETFKIGHRSLKVPARVSHRCVCAILPPPSQKSRAEASAGAACDYFGREQAMEAGKRRGEWEGESRRKRGNLD